MTNRCLSGMNTERRLPTATPHPSGKCLPPSPQGEGLGKLHLQYFSYKYLFKYHKQLLANAELLLAFPLRGRCQIRLADLTDEVIYSTNLLF